MDIYKITLLRHGESVGNAEGYYQGQYDFPLTPRGKNQVRRVVARWQADGSIFDQVIASPLKRAKETAEMVAEGLNVPLQFDPDWMERDNGKLGGMKREDADEQFPRPDFFTPYDNIAETGEGDFALYLRAGRAIQSILQMPPARYLVVSHGGILNQALHVILGITPQANGQGTHFRFRNTAFSTLFYEPDHHNWVFWGLNDFTHLVVKNVEIIEE
ncbi:histidine phosphatase family protein [Chloroflexota bacterium]|nr:histidine phosphatase family protein [Chloroflexota bacterium]